MSKHKYRFGDRVRWRDGTRGIVASIARDGMLYIFWEDGSSGPEPSDLITPGWPEDEDGEFVTVRAALGQCPNGSWCVSGAIGDSDDDMARHVREWFIGDAVKLSFIEARVRPWVVETHEAEVRS